ncbi:CaiB/BaiF CoA transferase family protein [Pseudonocardia nigra]|uniref:CaiB/BaiF CoA transferase family protein n=1 Tax=Pseudonocardia nigra TaxID=1921578 RepID=UPI001C5D4701|nr:CoA transferase [Pseudonocardia nigra]
MSTPGSAGSTGPLHGVRVVEVAGWMAAPGAAAVLADLGADVVKVEPVRGDAVRGVIRQPEVPEGAPPLDASFQMDNRGKRGVAIALDRPEGADLVRRLVAGADVFVNNLLGKRQRRFGLDAESLLTVNSRLVHATLTGYGLEGPDAARPGYDITAFFGRGGITHSITEPGSQAPRSRPAQGDHTAALAMVASILAALRLVERTGEGQVIDVSLLATAAWTMSTDLSASLVDGKNPRTLGRRRRLHALQESFCTADARWVLLFMPEAHWWPRFCNAVGHPEWAEDARFESLVGRREHMDEITDLMDALFATRPLADWARILDEAALIWAPAATVAELAVDPHAEAIGLFPEIEHPAAGRFRTVASPLGLRGAGVGPRGPAPEIGQHTMEVLREAGLTEEELAGLARSGVIPQVNAP